MTHRVESIVTRTASPVRVEHDVPPYMSADDALVHILSRYPTELLEINRYDFGENGKVTLTPGKRGRAGGETVLDAVKNGQLCITLREIEKAHPGLWGEIHKAFAELAPQIGITRASKMTGQMILSSATARFPYHFDVANTAVFHLRGVRRVWVYPTSENFLAQDEAEKAIMGVSDGQLTHVRIGDNAAWRFDIVPGEALALPLHSPHRIENDEGLCVTVVVSYETADSRIANGAYAAIGVLRRWGAKVPRMEETPYPAKAALWLASLAFAAIGLVKRTAPPSPRRGPDMVRCAIEQEWQIDRRSLAT